MTSGGARRTRSSVRLGVAFSPNAALSTRLVTGRKTPRRTHIALGGIPSLISACANNAGEQGTRERCRGAARHGARAAHSRRVATAWQAATARVAALPRRAGDFARLYLYG